jgi:phage baseplate assembly protein W
MAIRLKNFEQAAVTYTEQQYVFKDLALDIGIQRFTAPAFPQPINSNDIQQSFDLAAIKNSLTNLFNTLPGQRFLFPEYGLDVNQFLFEPITLGNADLIGNIIYSKIEIYEPRVKVVKVYVQADPDNSAYNITIIINVPVFNENTELPFTFDIKKQSFISLPTSRNI